MDDKIVDTYHFFKLEFENNPKYRWVSSQSLSAQIINEYLAKKTEFDNCNTIKSKKKNIMTKKKLN